MEDLKQIKKNAFHPKHNAIFPGICVEIDAMITEVIYGILKHKNQNR